MCYTALLCVVVELCCVAFDYLFFFFSFFFILRCVVLVFSCIVLICVVSKGVDVFYDVCFVLGGLVMV